MPLDPAGNASLVPSYFAEPGTTIRTDQHNPVLEDIASMLSQMLVRDGRNGMVGPLNMGSFPIKNVPPGSTSTDAANVSQLMPVGAIVDYAGASPPAGWFLCYGQALSRTAYASLFAALGTAYGAGDGSTTFNIPDLRGLVVAGRDDMGADAGRLSVFGALAKTLGSIFGAPTHTLSGAQMPTHAHGGVVTVAGVHAHTAYALGSGAHSHGLNDPGHAHEISSNANANAGSAALRSGNAGPEFTTNVTRPNSTGISVQGVGDHTHAIGVNPDGAHQHGIPAEGGGAAHNNTQPTTILNKIIKASL